MTLHPSIRAMGLAMAVLAAPAMAWAQGSSGETPRPPGSDPSTRVDQLQGRPVTPPGTTGNPTGRAIDRPATPPAANAVPARPAPGGMVSPGGTSSNPGNPASGGRTGGSAPTN